MRSNLMRNSPAAVRVALIAIVAYVLVFLVSPSAHANSCSDGSCEGLDPVATGCANDAYTARSTTLYRQSDGAQVGIAELRYSPACGTNWMRTRSYIGSTPMYAVVAHGTNWNSGHGFYATSTQVYTDMTATRYETACGYGYLDGGNWTGYQVVCA